MSKLSFLKKSYERVKNLSRHPKAGFWLGGISFVESSFFFVPADVLFVPMVLANQKKAFWYAFVATVMSVLGGILGYYIGLYGYEYIAKPFLEMIGKMDVFFYYKKKIQQDIFMLWGLLLSSGLTHIPPIKIITILSGVVKIPLSTFIVSAIVGRGVRFYLLALLFYKYGKEIDNFIQKNMMILSLLIFMLLLTVYIFIKFIYISSF